MSDEVQRMDFEKPESYAEAAKRIRKEHGLPELAPKASVPVLPPMQVDPETIQKADQRAIACVNMRLAGAPFWEIAQTLEYANAGSAKAAFIAAMAEMNPPEDWETLRQQEAMRAEQQLRRSIAMASADYLVDDETGQRIPNTEKLKWHEQASKDIALHVMITGAKAPNRIEVSATVQELNAMVNTLIAKQGGELEELEADVLAMDDLPPEAEPMGE